MTCDSSLECNSSGNCISQVCSCDFGFAGPSCGIHLLSALVEEFKLIKAFHNIYGVVFLFLGLRQFLRLYKYLQVQYQLKNTKVSRNYRLLLHLLMTTKGTVYVMLMLIGLCRGLWLLIDPFRLNHINGRFLDRLMDEICYFLEMALMFIILVMFINIHYQVREYQQRQKTENRDRNTITISHMSDKPSIDNTPTYKPAIPESFQRHRKMRQVLNMVRFAMLTLIFVFYLVGKSFRMAYFASKMHQAIFQSIYFMISMSAMIEVTYLLKRIFDQFNDMITINHNQIKKFQESCHNNKKEEEEEEEEQEIEPGQQLNTQLETKGEYQKVPQIFQSQKEVKSPLNTRTNRSLTLEPKRDANYSHKVSLQLDGNVLPLKGQAKEESIDLDKDLDDYYELDLRQNGLKEIFIDDEDIQWGFEAGEHKALSRDLKTSVKQFIDTLGLEKDAVHSQTVQQHQQEVQRLIKKQQLDNQGQQANETQSRSFRNKIKQNKLIQQDKSDLKRITRYSACCLLVVFVTLCFTYGFLIYHNLAFTKGYENRDQGFQIQVYMYLSFVFRNNEVLFILYFNRLVGDFEQSELKNLNWIRSLGVHNNSQTQFIFQMPEYMVISDQKKQRFQMRINQDSIQRLEHNKKKDHPARFFFNSPI